MAIVTVTLDSLDSLLAENELIVVDFWAQWCKPCLSFNKVVEAVSEEYPDVLFAKVNIEDEPELAREFDVQSVPAVLILRSQVMVYAHSGAMPAAALTELIEKAQNLDVSHIKEEGG